MRASTIATTLLTATLALACDRRATEPEGVQVRAASTPSESPPATSQAVGEPVRSEAPKPPTSFDLAAIDEYVGAYVAHKKLVGLSVAVMRDGEIAFAKGYGQRSLESGEPVVPETEFAIASISKQFVCTAAALLAEDGKLSLDDKVARYFPAVTRAEDITLFDALTHVAGYHDFYPLDFVIPRMREPVDTDALIAEFAGMPLDFEPRSRWSYSNTGYLIVGRAVERVAGEPLDELLNRRIFVPLGMEHTWFGAERRPATAATGYTAFALGGPEEAVPEGAGWIHAAGAMWSTPSDLLRWDRALVSGEVVKPGTYERMTTPVLLSGGRLTDYGCGLGIRRFQGESILVHTGGVSGFSSKNAVVPRTKSGVAVISNGAGASPHPVADTILSLVIEADRGTPKAPDVQGPAADLVARELVRQMQEGKLDRSRLHPDFSAYLSDARLAAAAPRLKALGEPEKVEVVSRRERGGMEVTTLSIAFASELVHGSMFRMPDGTVQQFLLFR